MFAKKSLGQNFLMHPQIAERIVHAAKLPEGAQVLEIGPGTGMLTRALLANGATVVAVEADNELAPQMEESFAADISTGSLRVIHGDIRVFDPATIDGEYHVVANIPYYITGEIIRSFLTSTHKPSSMTLLVQKEVAERIARSKKESLLSLSVKVFGTPEYCFTVPRGAFRPAPNVDSAVLAIRNIDMSAFVNKKAEEYFFSVVRTGFAHKRKRLAKNLEEIAPAAHIAAAFDAASLTKDIRPEDLSLSDWKQLTASLVQSA
ncbi:MAG: 16S rRNA (adenine1518-N6/adenine1519-N6)-dimethyltransferase [Parcubacteria bacterium C7867-007]|nr:MAG: 16S rRNA (adenine1518-N6/adenine1519-N6)-dimethyltransferase [Parcubacteria bacterium C7867-007]